MGFFLHKMDSAQTMYSPHFLPNNSSSYLLNTALKTELLIFLCIFFSETLITTVSKFIKTCNHTLVCLYLTDVELSHEGIIKCLFQFWAISDFSVSSTPYNHFLCSLCPSPFASGRSQDFFKSCATGVSQKSQNKAQMSGIISKSLGYMSHSSPNIFTQRHFHLLQHSPVSFLKHLLSATDAKEPFREQTPSLIHPWGSSTPHKEEESMSAEVRVKGASDNTI